MKTKKQFSMNLFLITSLCLLCKTDMFLRFSFKNVPAVGAGFTL